MDFAIIRKDDLGKGTATYYQVAMLTPIAAGVEQGPPFFQAAFQDNRKMLLENVPDGSAVGGEKP